MTLQNNRAPLLCFFKLCASFHTHCWIQIGVTVRKHSIRVKIHDFFSRVTQKYYEWPSKTTGHLFNATSSFLYHFVPIGEFKLELQSRNAQFGSNSMIFRAVRPWNLMDDLEKQEGTSSMLLQALCNISHPLVNSNWSYSPETPNLGQIQKLQGTSPKHHQAICIISSSYVNSNWNYRPETVKSGVDLCDLDLWPWPFAWTSLLSLVMTPENFMMIQWWEHSQKGVTDGQTDRRTGPFIELLGRS